MGTGDLGCRDGVGGGEVWGLEAGLLRGALGSNGGLWGTI